MDHFKHNMTIPLTLLGSAFGLYLFKAFTSGVEAVVKEFLINTVLEMLPLVIIKHKIVDCTDRMALLCRFAIKVLIMHMSLFIVSLVAVMLTTVPADSQSVLVVNSVSLVAAAALMHWGFNVEWNKFYTSEHRDIQVIHLFAFLYAAAAWKWRQGSDIFSFLINARNTIEICTFLPGIRMLYQMNRNAEIFMPLPQQSSQHQAVYFTLFMLAYYLHENIISPIYAGFPDLLFYGGHALHLALLVDFCGFFLFEAWAPKKGTDSEMMQAT